MFLIIFRGVWRRPHTPTPCLRLFEQESPDFVDIGGKNNSKKNVLLVRNERPTFPEKPSREIILNKVFS